MKRLNLIFLILGLIISACSSAPLVTPTAALELTPTQWSLPTSSPTETPSILSSSTPTHDKLERALASRVHWESNALCEWEVAGQTSQAIYVWAYCQSAVNDSAVSAPAVIHLGSDGHVQSVDMPHDGADYGPDVRALFPQDMQPRIFDQAFDIKGMAARLEIRYTQLRPTPTQSSSPTVTATSSAADGWQVYHDSSFGFSFQYPTEWHQSIRWYSPGWHGIVERIEVTHLSQPPGENAEILIDIWQSQHDLLTWLQDQSPDSLALNSTTIEGGLDTLTRYNAQIAGYPAIFVYDREHNSGTPDMADVFVANGQRVFRFMYSGDIPDDLANRAIYLRILETVRLAATSTQGLSLPRTSFTMGVTTTAVIPNVSGGLTATPIGESLAPIATAPAIRFESWSPQSDWLAYWSSTEADVASNSYPFPPGTLRFFNARTNQTCTYPTFVARDYRDRLVWRSDGQVIILSGDRAHIGKPCDKDFKPIEYDGPDVIIEPESALSPNGTYRAMTIARMKTVETFSVTTTITQVGTGQVKNTIEWKHPGGLGGLGLGGQWLTDDRFLIHETLDRGPLLISVGGEVVQAAPQLFGLPPVINPDREDFVGLRAVGAVVTGTATYHILIFGVGVEASFPLVKLYHSESGEVEELPFRHLWTPGLSPDGRWLLLDKPFYQDNHEQRALWIRSSDPVGSEARLFTENAAYTVWTPDWTQVAASVRQTVSIYTFPEGRPVGSWTADEYEVVPVAWSPDGRLLAVEGYVSGQFRAALSVIHQQ